MSEISPWVPARVVRQRVRDVGVGDAELLTKIAGACLSGRMIGSGYRVLHGRGACDLAEDRQRVGSRFWRFLRVEDGRFERIARWDLGQFHWSMIDTEGNSYQESWYGVVFDAPLFRIWLDEIVEGSAPVKANPGEIRHWLEHHCPSENYKLAWPRFKADFGKRAVPFAVFEPLFKAWKGNPGRGRPRKKPAG